MKIIRKSQIKQRKAEEERKRLLAKAARSIVCSVPQSAKITGLFIWPTSGRITQCFHNGHKAFDISDHSLPVVSATKSGTVTKAIAGYNDGYGTMVIIDHGDGYSTVYGHLSTLDVKVGDTVRQGQSLGRMGNTGRSTGPHLHFEIRYKGELQNPFVYMP